MAEKGDPGGEANQQADYPQDYPPEQPYPVEGVARQPDLAQQPYTPDAPAQLPYSPDQYGENDNYFAPGQYVKPPIEEREEEFIGIEPIQKPEGSEEGVEDLFLESYESEYINLGIPLTLAFADIVEKKPTDPIHYLGHRLFQWRYNQEGKPNEIEKVNALIRERVRLTPEEEADLNK